MSTINELFDRNPHDLTDEDFAKIIEDIRSRRKAFNDGAKQALSKSPRKTKAAEKVEAAGLSNLDLDL